LFNYHWPLHGFNLKPEILEKVYRLNAGKALKPIPSSAR
jgi:hypothetical protein